MDSECIKSVICVAPSYLRELFIDGEMTLVHLEAKPGHEDSFQTPAPNESTIVDDETLDVTGSPLEVNLKEDVSFALSPRIKDFDLWTKEETRHFSLSLEKARYYINHTDWGIKHEVDEKSLPVYVVCDGNNTEKTIILGAQYCLDSLMTCKVNILGCLSPGHELISIKHMEEEHIACTRMKDCKITYLTRFKYYLYGTFIQNISNIYASEFFGSISVELTFLNRCDLNLPKNIPGDKIMKLQVIIGHPASSVYFLWEDLCTLQSYLEIFGCSNKCNDPETVISNSHNEVSSIYKDITNILRSNLQREAKTDFNLSNIRTENVLDRLFAILKRCEDLSALRDAFHFLFEELAEAEINIHISEKNTSNIATIFNGIVEGRLAVPTITFFQALDFLFELGAEKMKNDYQAIMKHFYPMSEELISEKWSQLQSKLTLQDRYRKTRVTVNLKSGRTDFSQNVSKLAYLGKLHVATEFIYLVKKQTNLPQESFDYFCERIYKSYVLPGDTSEDFFDLHNSPLLEFSCSIGMIDQEQIKKKSPVTWLTRMTSICNENLEVTTLYHLSKFRIFPSSIYDGFVDILHADPSSYYVCKLEKYTEKI